MTATNSASSASSRPRVRLITWAILAWVIIMIAAIIGAWQGSESRYGAVPKITIATDSGHLSVLPYSAADLDGTTYTNPIPDYQVTPDQLISLRLPVELQRTSLMLFEVRESGREERQIKAGEAKNLMFPAVTDTGGALLGLAVRGTPSVYDSEGEESLITGEWSVEIVVHDDGTHPSELAN